MTTGLRAILKWQCTKSKKATVVRACYFNNNQNFNANDRNINNYNSAVRGIAQLLRPFYVMNYRRDLWQELCSYDNLLLAFKKARKHKTTLDYVIDFEKNLKDNLLMLRSELLLHCYQPKHLVSFIINDPKTRKISKSDFRDRVVHHALCNIIEPIFEKRFIYDSYANRVGKGTLKAIERFDSFKRIVSKNDTVPCYVLKADIRKYFETVDHVILINIIKKRIKDKRILWLIKKILANYTSKIQEKGMPLGNLTSQFFANVYLNELDLFVKHKLRAGYYLRYVDDFVILNRDKECLERYKVEISEFLTSNLLIELHTGKSKVIKLGKRLNFLGLRVFYYHKLLKKQNMRKFLNKLHDLKEQVRSSKKDYDELYDFLEGWIAYAKCAHTTKLRKKIISDFEREFPSHIATKEMSRILKEYKKIALTPSL